MKQQRGTDKKDLQRMRPLPVISDFVVELLPHRLAAIREDRECFDSLYFSPESQAALTNTFATVNRGYSLLALSALLGHPAPLDAALGKRTQMVRLGAPRVIGWLLTICRTPFKKETALSITKSIFTMFR
jgi:hypothetical protein